MSHILLTGSSGAVGEILAAHAAGLGEVLAPGSHELDITDGHAVRSYIREHNPSVIIHAAAYTDNTSAEFQRGDRQGQCWNVNVEGTRHIVEAAGESGTFVIYLSTGSVFSGDSDNPGPFTETDTPPPESQLSWYAYTKLEGERHVSASGAIVRISHPESYIRKLLASREPLFTDQYFPVTDLEVLSLAISRIAAGRTQGIFHVVSDDLVTPFQIVSYVHQIQGKKPAVASQTFGEFIAHAQMPKRYSQYSAITGKWTTGVLQLPSYSWRDVVNNYIMGRTR